MRLVVSKYELFPSDDTYIVSETVVGHNWNNIDCLVFNTCSDGEAQLFQELGKMKERVDKILYICENMSPIYFNIFHGMQADILNEESVLQDKETLDFVIDNYKEHGFSIKEPYEDAELVKKCINEIIKFKPEELITLTSNELWRDSLKVAVDNVNQHLIANSESNLALVRIMHSVSKFIDGLRDSQLQLTEEFGLLKQSLQELEEKGKSNVIMTYPVYPISMKVPKVFYIREISRCNFLLSFLHAYMHYLKIKQGLSVKILVIAPRTKNYMTKYKDFARLSQDTISMVDFSNEVYVTYEPKKVVLDRFFNAGCDMYITVDMLGNDKILSGQRVEEFYAISALSDRDKFKLPNDRIINSGQVTISGFFTIPYIPNYVKSTSVTKTSLYSEKCTELYEKLDVILLKGMNR